jgi:hypothetical protein
MTHARNFGFALVAAASIALTACDSGSSQPAQPAQPTQPAQPAGPIVEPLTAAQMTKMQAVFAEAQALATRADAHRKAGDEAARAGGGQQAAIPHYQEAKPLYRQACQMVEDWIEPDLGIVTEGQVEEFLRPEVAMVHKWQKGSAAMGKVPPKE